MTMHDSVVAWVYALRDPRTDAVRYVGLTTNIHLRENSHHANTWPDKSGVFLKRWRQELESLNLKPRLQLLYEVRSIGERSVRWFAPLIEQAVMLHYAKRNGPETMVNGTSLRWQGKWTKRVARHLAAEEQNA